MCEVMIMMCWEAYGVAKKTTMVTREAVWYDVGCL